MRCYLLTLLQAQRASALSRDYFGFCFVPRYDLLFACTFVSFYFNRLSFDMKLVFILFRVTYLFVVCIGLCLLLFQQGRPKRILFLVAYSLVVCMYFNLFSI